MADIHDRLIRKAAFRGKYAPLYRYLSSKGAFRWEVSFAEVEAILGFDLPASARIYRSWWSNQKQSTGNSHALAWRASGWKTRNVDMKAEILVFVRETDAWPRQMNSSNSDVGDIDEFWPAIPGGFGPEGFTASRKQIYDEFGRLTGGPQAVAIDAK